ncbi:type ISP restriction/modification enzyme, partial [Thiospirillum jenense]
KRTTLVEKVQFFIRIFNQSVAAGEPDYSIKWSSTLQNINRPLYFDSQFIMQILWRPFVRKYFYADKSCNDRLTKLHYQIYGHQLKANNNTMILPGLPLGIPFSLWAVSIPTDYHFLGYSSLFPLWIYADDGTQHDNITDWSLNYFQQRYHDTTITKWAIFDYVYAVLHDSRYRQQFALNLKSEFPRIPTHPDFWAWSRIGGELVQLHAEFETVPPWPLKRVEQEIKMPPKCRLKANKTDGTIEIDSATTLMEIPASAWEYQLGTRTALEWVLDQYKERPPKDPTIRAQFNTYQFADYKEQVIELLARVCRVSVATVNKMQQLAQLRW